jgi:hypothetical protein
MNTVATKRPALTSAEEQRRAADSVSAQTWRSRALGKPDPMTEALSRWVSEGGAFQRPER